MHRIFIITVFVLFSLFLFSFSFCEEEEFTITTYYPSPYGVYKELRLYPNTAPNPCDSNNKGAMYYNDTDNQVYVCDGSNWKIMGGFWNLSGNNLYPAQTSYNVGIGITSPGTYKLNVSGDVTLGDGTGTDLLVGNGAGKIDCGTIDPVFEITKVKYATYMSDFAGGVRVETSGTVKLSSIVKQFYYWVVDFTDLEVGSDLWLFWQTSNKNLKDLSVLLTPNFAGKAWYKKEGNKLIIYGDQKGEVSYRLSVPRFDHKSWSNIYSGVAKGMEVK